jgi:hypothetical protein
MARAWWRFEAWTTERWDDGWKPRGFWRPKLRRLNRYGPPPHALAFAWMRMRLVFWYRDRLLVGKHPRKPGEDTVALHD